MESLPADGSPSSLFQGKGLMLGAWLFADNSSRAPGAPWGGAVGMPSLRIVRHGDEGACGTARRSRVSRQGGRAAVSGSASGCRPHSLAAGRKRSGAGCETPRFLSQLTL